MKKSIIALLISFNVFAHGTPNEYYQSLTKDLLIFKSCDLTQIWEDYSWDRIDYFFFTSPINQTTFKFDFQKEVDIPMRFEETPGFALSTYGKDFKDENRLDVAYKLDSWRGDDLKDYDQLMKLILHENFHFVGQGKIKEQGSSPRGDNYPYKVEPRLYRAMVIYHLSQALKKQANVLPHLSKAKYWNEKHRKEFYEDYVAVGDLDLREGSASYVEILSHIFMKNDCEFSQSSFDEMFFDPELGESHIVDHFYYTEDDKSGQSYIGGMLAFMIDYVLFQNNFELIAKTKEAKHPIEELLANSTEEVDSYVDEVKQPVEEQVKKANEQAKEVVEFYAKAKEEGYSLVSFDGSVVNNVGSFRLLGFINTDEATFGFNQAMKNVTALYRSEDSEVKTNAVHIYKKTENVCGQSQYSFWVKDLVVGETIEFEDESVKIKSKNFEKKNEIICLK